ncbi:methyltransferase [Georgenia sp. 10Sc9-8]|uniref:Methyltransferase n=1 Tax=Georgenia halotolerans TaxID=3028317 RepID=A0ABT5TW60_9MICO|nr:methyltransferase [Georgenia halotolerans]
MDADRDASPVPTMLVTGQMLLLAALAWPVDWPVRRPRRGVRLVGLTMLATGGALALAGGLALGPALTPSPVPRAGADLRTEGLYGRVRHPIYSGLLLAAGGRALSSGRRRHAVVALALTGLLDGKARYEEVHLRRVFPGYDAYAARTPRLVPALRAQPR